MDESFDSVDRIEPYPTAQRVKRSHQSAREKDKKFASVLKDEMEEEQRRKRKRKKQKDEVILQGTEEKASEESAEESTTESTDDSTSDDGDSQPPRIDVKA